jgi:predicted metal-dependent HD superfamily phosphohydrolase
MAGGFADRFPALAAGLRGRYGEAHRHYHNMGHVDALLTGFAAVRDSLESPDAVELAVWYHDAVYDPHAGDNEAKSADLLLAELTGAVDVATLDRAEGMIRATFGHRLPEELGGGARSDCAAFLDLDLAILGADESTFDAYDDNIRKEYRFVPDDLYRPARRAVLEGFLGRPRLYFTEPASRRLELPARTNLQRAIDRLAGG